jgi:hypothetical protein
VLAAETYAISRCGITTGAASREFRPTTATKARSSSSLNMSPRNPLRFPNRSNRSRTSPRQPIYVLCHRTQTINPSAITDSLQRLYNLLSLRKEPLERQTSLCLLVTTDRLAFLHLARTLLSELRHEFRSRGECSCPVEVACRKRQLQSTSSRKCNGWSWPSS